MMFPGNEPDNLTRVTEFPYAFESTEPVWIPMADGVRLAARIWRPLVPAGQRVPAVLEYIPYRLRDGRRVDDELIHPFLAGHGIAGVRVDIRGSGDSDGLLQDEYLLQEQEDALAIIAWLAAQPWCNGNVGMMGLSWGGFNSLQVAARRPPALKAIIAVGATVDRYNDDVHYKGGCLLNENMGWGSGFMSFCSRPPDPLIVGERWREMWLDRLDNLPLLPAIWLQHNRRDAYWRHGSICEDYRAIQCPVMIVTGWGDGYVNAVPRLLENLAVPTRAIAGPWAHQYPHLATPGPAIDFLGEAVAWWQQWLAEEVTTFGQSPRYRAYRAEGAHSDNWAANIPGQWLAADWVGPAPHRHTFYLTNRGLDHVRGELASPRIQSPADCGAAGGEFIPHCKGTEMPGDQRLDDGKSLLFDSPILTEPLDLWGDAELTLTLVSDRPVANLVARLGDVAPDGRSGRVTLAALNLTQRHSQSRPEAVPVGQPFTVTLKFDHVCHRFLAGHRLRLALSTAYWPMIWPAADPAILTLVGQEATLKLPFPENATPIDMAPPQVPSVSTIRPLDLPVNERQITFDPGRHETTVTVLDFYGRSEIIDHGMIFSGRKEEAMYIKANDPQTASHVIVWQQTLTRDNWAIETELTAQLRGTAANYSLDVSLTARENGVQCWQNQWQHSSEPGPVTQQR